MAAHVQKGRKTPTIGVPIPPATPGGKVTWKNVSAGTRDKVAVRGMERMVRLLGPRELEAYDLLAEATTRDGLRTLFREWSQVPGRFDAGGHPVEPSPRERVAHIRQLRRGGNLLVLAEQWGRALRAPGRERAISEDTAKHYEAAVWALLAAHLDVEDTEVRRWRKTIAATPPGERPVLSPVVLTPEWCADYFADMDDAEPATIRKRGIGVGDFTDWLRRRARALAVDPMLEVTLPAPGEPRCHFLDTPEVQQLADAKPDQYRRLDALLAGTGLEVSVALALRRRDVEQSTREIRAPGTKTYNRDRVVRVAEWAWPYLEPLLAGRHPDARLFDAIPDRWAAARMHRETVVAMAARIPRLLEQGGYTLRDHRHTWAVRAVRGGWPIEAVRRQLGHKDGVLALKVYGRFQPTNAEREHWEQMAAARDAARAKELGR